MQTSMPWALAGWVCRDVKRLLLRIHSTILSTRRQETKAHAVQCRAMSQMPPQDYWGGRTASSEHGIPGRESKRPPPIAKEIHSPFCRADDVTVDKRPAHIPSSLAGGPWRRRGGGGTAATSCTHLEKFHPGGAARATTMR